MNGELPRSTREYVLNFHKKQYRRLVQIEAREHGAVVVLNQEQVLKSKGKHTGIRLMRLRHKCLFKAIGVF